MKCNIITEINADMMLLRVNVLIIMFLKEPIKRVLKTRICFNKTAILIVNEMVKIVFTGPQQIAVVR